MVCAEMRAGITLRRTSPAATAIWRRLFNLSVARVTARIHSNSSPSPRSRNVSRCKRSWPSMIEKRILRRRQVLERLGIRKTTLYESFIKTGRLRFVKIGARAVGIIEDELDALIEELRRERDRRP